MIEEQTVINVQFVLVGVDADKAKEWLEASFYFPLDDWQKIKEIKYLDVTVRRKFFDTESEIKPK